MMQNHDEITRRLRKAAAPAGSATLWTLTGMALAGCGGGSLLKIAETLGIVDINHHVTTRPNYGTRLDATGNNSDNDTRSFTIMNGGVVTLDRKKGDEVVNMNVTAGRFTPDGGISDEPFAGMNRNFGDGDDGGIIAIARNISGGWSVQAFTSNSLQNNMEYYELGRLKVEGSGRKYTITFTYNVIEPESPGNTNEQGSSGFIIDSPFIADDATALTEIRQVEKDTALDASGSNDDDAGNDLSFTLLSGGEVAMSHDAQGAPATITITDGVFMRDDGGVAQFTGGAFDVPADGHIILVADDSGGWETQLVETLPDSGAEYYLLGSLVMDDAAPEGVRFVANNVQQESPAGEEQMVAEAQMAADESYTDSNAGDTDTTPLDVI